MTEARTLEEEVMDTTTAMSKEMDAWMKKGDGWMAIVLGKMHNAVMVPMMTFSVQNKLYAPS